MKYLITGASGLLGSNLLRYLKNKNLDVAGTYRSHPVSYRDIDIYQGDLLDPQYVSKLWKKTKPDVVINTVGLVNVNECEKNPSLAHELNVKTVGHIANQSRKSNTRLIHISTDHLFDGEKSNYSETDSVHPINEYGKSKRLGEIEAMEKCPNSVVIRTNFYGWSPEGHAPTFGEWLYNSLSEKKPIKLFDNYYFTSLEVMSLCDSLEKITNYQFTGLLNVVSSERCSKYDFGKAMADIFSLPFDQVTRSTLDKSSLEVPRPPDLSLSTKKYESLFHEKPPGLREGLEIFKETQKVKA